MKLADMVKDIQTKTLSNEEKIDLLGQIVMEQQIQLTEMQQKLDVLAGGAGA